MKNKYAGGGAGINFLIKDTDNNLIITVKGSPENYTFEVKGGIKINSFNAEGYDDGMDNVDGNKIFSNINVENVIENAKNIINELIEHFLNNQAYMENFIDDLENGIDFQIFPEHTSSYTTIFAGWVRGKLKEGDVIEFNDWFELSSDWIYDNNEFQATIYASLSKEGEYWYEDVFEYLPEDEDDWEIHYNDIRENYGV